MTKVRRCHECGIGTVRQVAKKGRVARFKNMPSLEIPATIKIPTCDKCGAEWLDAKTSARIDSALEEVYRAELQKRVGQAMDAITAHVSQRKLEALLGLSQGYLSKLKSGEREPSAELVGNLALIAKDPTKRLRELERFWAAA